MTEKQLKLIKPFFGTEQKEFPIFYYIVITELPDDQKIPFEKWIRGQTQPVINDNLDCAYSWDYSLWYDYCCKGEEAPVTD